MSNPLPKTLGLCAALAVAAVPARVLAQSVNNTRTAAVLLGTPAAAGLICNVGTLAGLVSTGTARRGFTITGVSVAGATLLSSGLLMLVSGPTRDRALFTLAATGLSFGLATLALNLYGVFHPHVEPEPLPRAMGLPGQLSVVPLFGAGRDERMAGLSLSTTW